MDDKFTNRFNTFCSSLASLQEAKDRDLSDDFVLSGTVQKFNLTFDISWKVMKDILVQHYGIIDFPTGSPRETLKKAASVGLITSDTWIDMLNHRNTLAHDYDGFLAKEIAMVIVNDYVELMVKFKDEVNKIAMK
ncbi:MAG: nucleotidyltransferase substrate binding protein [Pseudobutyrivibrio sp.]|nr:nucleotidyltransferase substrate binding protein [Pseudobutyrivibrio sp.]